MNKRLPPELLQKYGFTTADKVPQPPPKPRDVVLTEGELAAAAGYGQNVPVTPEGHPAIVTPIAPQGSQPRERWTREKSHAFDLLAPHALYVASTDGPVSITVMGAGGEVKKRFGHNRGCWPVRIDTTASWRDQVTKHLDKDPFFPIAVKRRVWLPMASEANALALHVAELLSRAAQEAGFEQLLHGYVDAGPEFDPVSFERHILLLAKRMDVLVWTEEALSKFLDKVLAAAKMKGILILNARGHKIQHPGFAKLADRMVEQEREKQFVGKRA